MKAKLSPENLKELWVSSRPGIFISAGLFIAGLLFLLVNVVSEPNDNSLINSRNNSTFA